MPDHPFPDSPENQQHRPERKPLVCFAADAETEEALRTPTDGYVPPDDAERILLFRQLARQRGLPPRLPGAAGFGLN